MTWENITRCSACGAEGGKLYWLTTPKGPVLYDDKAPHVCKPTELQELL